jgi:hypothetical protein
MSYSADPVLDAERHYDSIDRERAEREREEDALSAAFLAAAKRGDMHAFAPYAGRTTDWDNKLPGGGYGTRAQTVGEVMWDTLDGPRGQITHMAMKVLCAAAQGALLQGDAAELIEQMARVFAQQNAGG